jgi:hypothetical protein
MQEKIVYKESVNVNNLLDDDQNGPKPVVK